MRNILWGLLLSVWVLVSVTRAADGPHRVGLVIRYSTGQVETYCVTFSEPEITGVEVLERSGVPLIVDPNQSVGTAVCKIGNEGCDYPLQDCFCQCQGVECMYWAYYHLVEGHWVYSRVGASSYKVHDGDVEGWSWGPGEPGHGDPPPVIPFSEICSGATATPTPTLTPSPTTTPTSTPSPTSTFSPTPTLSPTATHTPTSTPIPVSPPLAATPTPSPTWTAASVLPSPSPATRSPLSPVSSPTFSPPPNPTVTPTSPSVAVGSLSPVVSPPPTLTPTSTARMVWPPTLPPNAVIITPPRPQPGYTSSPRTPSPVSSLGGAVDASPWASYVLTLAVLGGVALVVYVRQGGRG